MPPSLPKACRKPGCGRVTTNSDGLCDAHKNYGWESHQRGQSRHQRGYGNAWEKLRAIIWQRDKGLCQNHLRLGVALPASCVDHIKPKAHGGTDDPANLECLCRRCHAEKTARERLGNHLLS
ncbi:HNH endonuclease [Escherichia coli]|uniref:HNH endonuclease n=1 Tax=Escherichia coli TaxID=562 RepID=UPI00185A66D9|nr:HNH endonuclease signature motif containing protein [Escherichia coli]EET3366313.1 HNH endonuclease [Escherichia coli]EET9690677.1 HNH endonuclease [Escherichia coli]EFC4678175.1 HNH endonuclease [Escherichia coli]EFP2693197.1 HNH endonuclease [Escherichia coli]EHV2481907.1 HNH endonuclease [Escherichia coli]